jgi:hypothetical protein
MSELSVQIDQANQKAMEILAKSRPRLIDIKPAIEVIPGMKRNMILHAGPPISFKDMCSSQKNALAGAAIFEGLARDLGEAKEKLMAGEVAVEPCHEHNAVGSMAGPTSATMPVLVVQNEPYGNRAYNTLNEGPMNNRLIFGAFSEEVLNNLEWIRQDVGPAIGEAVRSIGGVDVLPIIARSLTMGDECHNRSTAGSAIFMGQVIPSLIDSSLNRKLVGKVASYMAAAELFFLHVVMASAKAIADAMSKIPLCSIVTAISRNGIQVGIRVGGTGDKWMVGPAQPIEGVYYPGFGPEDAEADMGDSAITEVVGLGAFAMGCSVPHAYTIGVSAKDAIRFQESMTDITVARHPVFKVPALDFIGTPVGIDIRKVVQTNLVPIINTGIAHKKGGKIGGGIARVPMECFNQALEALGRTAKLGQTRESEC